MRYIGVPCTVLSLVNIGRVQEGTVNDMEVSSHEEEKQTHFSIPLGHSIRGIRTCPSILSRSFIRLKSSKRNSFNVWNNRNELLANEARELHDAGVYVYP